MLLSLAASQEIVLIILLITLLIILASALFYTVHTLQKYRAKLALAQAKISETAASPAIISHEIRTPIALIAGSAELLNEGLAGQLNPQQQAFVQTISENCAQVINIAENFLAEAKLKNTPNIVKEQVDLRSIVTQTARELRRTTPVPINVDTSGGILEIAADPQLLRQLIWNLINNCVRHAGDDVQVNVRVSNSEAGGALLIISDNGNGISPTEAEKIYTPFTTGSTRKPGTGIGMMVAQKIVNAHGGKIMLDTLPGKGTAFHVLLPAK